MDRIWWEQVTNAASYIRQILRTVEDGKNILLKSSEKIPWFDTMRSVVKDLLDRKNCLLEMVEDTPSREPGALIFYKYCRPEKQDDYRPSIGYAKFLADSDDIKLNDRIVWIRNICEERLSLWMQFVEAYGKSCGKIRKGLFILEFQKECKVSSRKGIQVLDFEKSINLFDCFLFMNLLSSSLPVSEKMKHYLAELAFSIVQNDVELGARCIQKERYGAFLENPKETLQEIAAEELQSNGKEFSINWSEETLQRKIWNAQIKTIFPLIESYRAYFIHRYRKQVLHYFEENKTTQLLKEEMQAATPNDLELGVLWYYGRNDPRISQEEQKYLSVFRDARNKMAHLEPLDNGEIKEIFSILENLEDQWVSFFDR